MYFGEKHYCELFLLNARFKPCIVVQGLHQQGLAGADAGYQIGGPDAAYAIVDPAIVSQMQNVVFNDVAQVIWKGAIDLASPALSNARRR